MIKKVFLVWFAAALCATAEPWETADDFVTVLGDELRIHGSPVTFVCATGVSLPALPAASTSEAERAVAWTNAVQTGRALAGQLARCGVDEGVIEDTLAELFAEDGEELSPARQAILRLLERPYGARLAAGETDKVKAALARRGFTHEDIRAALAAWQEQREE